MQGGAVQPGRPARAHFPRSARVFAAPRFCAHAGLRGCDVRNGAGAHRLAAACESRSDGSRGIAALQGIERQRGFDARNSQCSVDAQRLRALQSSHKVPALRLRTIEEAGKLSIAFTTGILIGIGETFEERVDSLFVIRALHEQYGHIQEVIVQNFRAKPDIPMAHHPEPSMEDMLRTTAIARLILGPHMNLQAPPNLSYADFPRLLAGGINDWGGISPVTKDFINPEAAWPQIAKLRAETAARGFTLRERLALYPEFVKSGNFLSARVRERAHHLADADGFAA